MDIQNEREKRKILVDNMNRLLNELNSLIKSNINIIEGILSKYSLNHCKIKDWPKKVLLFRSCEWINQIRNKIDELTTVKFVSFKNGLKFLNDLKIDTSLKIIETQPLWRTNTPKLLNLHLPIDCSHMKCHLNLDILDCDHLNNLLKTEFVYRSLIDRQDFVNNQNYGPSDDYFLTTSVDLRSGTIEFFGKEDKMQIIEPKLVLDTHENINGHFKDPLVIKVGITSLKLFFLRARIEIGLSFLYLFTEFSLDKLETFAFSSEIERRFLVIIKEEEILNEEFRNVLYKEIEDFLNYLLGMDIPEYGKFLIWHFLLISFPVCLCHFDLKAVKKSKYFYLIKWAVPDKQCT